MTHVDARAEPVDETVGQYAAARTQRKHQPVQWQQATRDHVGRLDFPTAVPQESKVHLSDDTLLLSDSIELPGLHESLQTYASKEGLQVGREHKRQRLLTLALLGAQRHTEANEADIVEERGPPVHC